MPARSPVAGAKREVRADEVARLAADLCRIPSPSGSEGDLAEFIHRYLRDAGVDAYLQEVVPGRPNVVARIGKRGARQLVLVGHLDSSTAAGWQRDPFDPQTHGDRLEAGGVTDMKGGLAAMLTAVGACVDGGMAGEIVLICAMGHSPLGLGTKYALLTEGPWSGIGIFGQSSGLKAHTANGGSIKFEIQVSGRTAHIANAGDAIDALHGARRIADRLDRLALTHKPDPRLPDLPRLVVGEFTSGASPARVPGGAALRGDIRSVRGMSRISVVADLEAAVAAADVDPRVTVGVRVTHVQTPFVGDPDGPAMALLAAAHESATGRPLELARGMPSEAFITDAADLAEAGLDAVMYGPSVWRNEPGEWASIRELVEAAQVYLRAADLVGSPTTGM